MGMDYVYRYEVIIVEGADRKKILKKGQCTGYDSEDCFTKITHRVRRQLLRILKGFEILGGDIPYVKLQ